MPSTHSSQDAVPLGHDAAPVYEQQLQNDLRWALSEGSRHFDEKSAVFAALHKVVARLDALQIPYAIVGGMALFRHGFRRFTEDVDILVRKSDLKMIHEKLAGLGYLPLRPHSKHLRDTENGVRIEFLTTGDFPGDGKPKPLAFPDPARVSHELDSIHYVNLENLVEMKLAAGMTGAGRLKDLADVEELIKLLQLPPDFAQRLDPYVREKYTELWKQSRRRFVAVLPQTAGSLPAMLRDGVSQETEGVPPGQVRLVTTDPDLAAKHGLLEESEFWDSSEGA
jgi:hypothetical protein